MVGGLAGEVGRGVRVEARAPGGWGLQQWAGRGGQTGPPWGRRAARPSWPTGPEDRPVHEVAEFRWQGDLCPRPVPFPCTWGPGTGGGGTLAFLSLIRV